jgi:hypothetical protein
MARTMRERYVKALRLLRIGVSHLLIKIHRAPYDARFRAQQIKPRCPSRLLREKNETRDSR